MKKIIIAALLLFFIVGLSSNLGFRERRYRVKGPENLTICHISDLHGKMYGDKLIENIKKNRPDLIVVTGDLISRNARPNEELEAFLEKLVKICDVYCVTGNHEASNRNYYALEKILQKRGVVLLDGKTAKIKNKIFLHGIKDPAFFDALPVEKQLPKTGDRDGFHIVLSHRPEYFRDYVDGKADLVLAGHAHGGQIRLPLIGALVAPDQGLFPKFTRGKYREKNTTMIVSAGLGNSVIPFRFYCPPEIVYVEIVKN